jgi:hypothetical protein
MSIAAPLAGEPRSALSAAPTSYAPAPLALALAVFALCAFSPSVLNDGDTFSHIATGQWILEHRAVPHTDPFTFSFAGAPWTAHEWLSEVFLALAYRLAGFAGVMLLTGAAAAMAVYIVTRRTVDRLAGPAGFVLALGSLALIAPGLLARPHILALPCLVVFAAGLMDARESGRKPALGLAGVMWLWANLHGGYAFGLALALLFGLEAVWRADRDQRLAVAQGWVLFFYACLVAALATPSGLDGLLFPFKLLGNSELSGIGEWRPEDFSHPGPMEFFLLALIGFALVKPLRLDLLSAALMVGLIHLSLQHSRHQLLLAVLAPMLLARPVAAALETPAPAPPASRRLALAFLAGGVALAGARLALPVKPLDTAVAPSRALAALPEALKAKNGLNGYGFGGYLICAHVRPFIDGRADMFGPEFLASYRRIAAGDPEAIETAMKRYDIGWTIFPPESAANAALDREAGWRRIYADSHAVVHARAGAEIGLRSD